MEDGWTKTLGKHLSLGESKYQRDRRGSTDPDRSHLEWPVEFVAKNEAAAETAFPVPHASDPVSPGRLGGADDEFVPMPRPSQRIPGRRCQDPGAVTQAVEPKTFVPPAGRVLAHSWGGHARGGTCTRLASCIRALGVKWLRPAALSNVGPRNT